MPLPTEQMRIHEQEQLVANVLAHKRSILLRAYRDRLPAEDVEDCLSQAALELLLRARVGAGGATVPFHGPAHVANALEQKLRSRIHDRQRARGGRSAIEAALAGALSLGAAEHGGVDVIDARAGTEETVANRMHLRALLRLARRLTADQRLLLGCRLQLDLSAREFCERFGWSLEKYRKVDQRTRARLCALTSDAVAGVGVQPLSVASE